MSSDDVVTAVATVLKTFNSRWRMKNKHQRPNKRRIKMLKSLSYNHVDES